MRLQSAASLVDHVPGVVGMCSDEEMVRANAGPVVTVMTDEKAFRYWSVVERPCGSVGENRMAVPHHELSVSVPSPRCGPLPASFRNDEVTIEPFFRGLEVDGSIGLQPPVVHLAEAESVSPLDAVFDFALHGDSLHHTYQNHGG